MEIILKEDIVNLGYKNDIVTVKSGYGRNYLIPTGKAVIASPSAIQIADELAKLGHNIDRKIIVVKDAVKEVGNYKAIVKLHKEVSVEIPFEVVAEEA